MNGGLSSTRALRRLIAINPTVRCINPQRRLSTWKGPLSVSDEVGTAIKNNKPVVALETTIYTHGFPYPQNIALSSSLETLVREQGAIPATIGILNGVAKVGMQPNEIVELLEKAGDPHTIKVSRRDLGFICARKNYYGGTTIAGTLVLAHLAGIKVFATGGLGGVHRDKPGETSMDISADLTELGRTPMALVSSGCKSFLDLPRTLEFLETQGVGVGTFADGREGSVKFPAFWTRESDIQSPNTIKDEREGAAVLHAQLQLPLGSGLFFANPIPLEYSLPKEMMDDITAQVVAEAAEKGIFGSANTPYILSRIRELTKGGTVEANRKLIEANVIRGAKLAVELTKLEAETESYDEPNHSRQSLNETSPEGCIDVLVAGSIALDLSCNYEPHHVGQSTSITPNLHTSNPASVQQTLGGVGQNVATASHYKGAKTLLCSLVGDDAAGRSAKSLLSRKGLRTDGIVSASDGVTAQYVAVNDRKKDLMVAMADMRIFETTAMDFNTKWKPLCLQGNPKWAVLDANWSPNLLKQWILGLKEAGSKTAYEPVSAAKSTRLLKAFENFQNDSNQMTQLGLDNFVDLATPNQMEVQAMSDAIPIDDHWAAHISHLAEHELVTLLEQHLGDPKLSSTKTIVSALRLLSLIPCVLTKLGPDGVLQAELLQHTDPRRTSERAKQYIIYIEPLRYMSRMQSLSKQPTNQQSLTNTDSTPIAVYLRHHPAHTVKRAEDIVSVNGVGDTLLGALVADLSLNPGSVVEDRIQDAQAAALQTLMSLESVSPAIKHMVRA